VTAVRNEQGERTSLLSLDDARAQMLDGVAPLPVESVALGDALGRVLAEPLDSLLTLPPWDNSAMDGFAVRAQDIVGASQDDPVELRVIGESAAGSAASMAVEEGTAIRILTGAPLPEGADAVIPVEDTDAPRGVAALPERVAITSPRSPGAHIRRAGSDLREGYPLLAPGTLMSAAALAVAAAGGHARLSVHRRPRVAVLATGDELAPIGEKPGRDQIPDSNSVGLVAQAREAGAEATSLGIAKDDLADVVRHLRKGMEWADAVIVSGGVSVGAHDVVKDAFSEVGRVDLWRVAVQPGKPVAFGRAQAQGEDAQPVLFFGLPGNPVSSFVTFELFVRPILRRMSGHGDVIGRDVVTARLLDDVSKSPGRRAFLRVQLAREEKGWTARLSGKQDSHVLSGLAASDGLAIVSEDDDSLAAGAEVEVIRLR
jgi:molybdopterin molybdotransferase